MENRQVLYNVMTRRSSIPAAFRQRRTFRQAFPFNALLSVVALAALALSAGTALAGTDSKPTLESNRPLFMVPVPDHPLNQSLKPEIYAEGLEQAIETIQAASVDLAALEYISAGDGSAVRTKLVRGVPGQALAVRLPGHDRLLTLHISRIEQKGDVRSLSGKVAGHPSSLFTITMQGASVLAKIHLGPKLYVLEDPPGLSTHILKVVDKRRIPAAAYRDDTPSASSFSSAAKGLTEIVKATVSTKSLPENGNVRVLFLYTPAVQNRNNVTTLTNNIIAETNASLLDSSVAGHFYVTKAGANVLSNNFDTLCNRGILDRMGFETFEFSNLSNDMDAVYADIAFAIVKTDNTLGDCHDDEDFGRVGGAARPFDPADPVALSTDTYAVGDLTAPHEIGHVFGGEHEDPDCIDHQTGVPSSACGWVPDSGPYFQTMMGGYVDTNCSFDGLPASCERIAYWSDPNLFVNGEYIGDSGARMVDALQGTSGQSATMGRVARQWDNSDPYPYSRPSAPSSLTVHDEQCYGLHTVSWSSSTNADHYQLLRSLSSSFSSPEVIFRGASTGTGITVDSGTWYLRARACNGDGCSDVGEQKSASYYPGCN